MALSVSQILAASYNAVVATARKPENQWSESAFMREMERQGMIDRIDFGPVIEIPVDYRRNPNAGFNATELETLSLNKTDVISALQFSPAELTVPMVWSKKDEATNPSQNQKIALVKSIITNGLNTHDDLIEQAMFTTTTSGFLGLMSLLPDDGQGTGVGGVDATAETWHRNPVQTYTGASDIEAKLTTLYNQVIKGSGSSYIPKVLISGATPHATFEGVQQGLQRYVDTQEANAGFKVLAFKTARWSFSQYGDSNRVFMLTNQAFSLKVSKGFFRQRDEDMLIVNQNGYATRIYSVLQSTVSNKSRLGLAKT